LRELREGWDEAASTDPFFNILSDSDKEHGKWDVGEFFERGRADVAQLFAGLSKLGYRLGCTAALDFGCGVGRCTQALAGEFTWTYGVDISPKMVLLARHHNKGRRCIFRLNDSERLEWFADGSCDFVYSQFVLQHMDPELQLGYIREFIRVLKPEGIAAFVLSEKNSHHADAPWRSMYALPLHRIQEIDNTLEMGSVMTTNGHFRVLRKP